MEQKSLPHDLFQSFCFVTDRFSESSHVIVSWVWNARTRGILTNGDITVDSDAQILRYSSPVGAIRWLSPAKLKITEVNLESNCQRTCNFSLSLSLQVCTCNRSACWVVTHFSSKATDLSRDTNGEPIGKPNCQCHSGCLAMSVNRFRRSAACSWKNPLVCRNVTCYDGKYVTWRHNETLGDRPGPASCRNFGSEALDHNRPLEKPGVSTTPNPLSSACQPKPPVL